MNPKSQHRSQDVGDARDLECLPRKAAGNEGNENKGKARWATASKVIRVGLPKPFGVQNLM
jgi:hypothetical protein